MNSSLTIPLVTNSISQVFGEVVALGKGAVWATPAFEDNAKVCVSLLERFDSFLDIQSSLRAPAVELVPKQELAQSEVNSIRDVFISHASEDKAEVARPLAEALKAKGLSVWFDEGELTLGDRLRRKIEEGLRISRYGVTILSDSFFRKPWPQAELDALFALERESKKILPVWHGLSASDIARYTPLLADRLAVSTDVGIEGVAASNTASSYTVIPAHISSFESLHAWMPTFLAPPFLRRSRCLLAIAHEKLFGRAAPLISAFGSRQRSCTGAL